jgi:hypothetical protein
VVGAHIAELLGRETFNLYGSLKRRKIDVWSVDEQLLSFLHIRGCIYAGSTSATLVKLDDISEFVFLTLEENQRRKMRCTTKTSTKRTRASNETEEVASLRNLKQLCMAVEHEIEEPRPL